MTRPLLKHLDDEEIEALLQLYGSSAEEPVEPPGSPGDEILNHLLSCVACERKLQMHRDIQSELDSLKSLPLEDAGDCPENVDWTSVAAGLLPAEQTHLHLQHAANCMNCGPLLKNAIADLSDAATEEEETILKTLKSDTTEWQGTLAEKLRQANAPPQATELKKTNLKLFLKPWMPLAAAAVLIAVIGPLIFYRYFRPAAPLDLVARAYAEHRTLELRIPGAARAPMHVERGGAASNLDRPAPLLQAEELIAEGLRKTPNDITFLDAKARADLLDGNYDSAIASLERALETQPTSQVLLTDLATAFFMRAEATDHAIDYGLAIENLGKVLAASPNDSAALFNRAIAEERLHLYSEAIRDWTLFLQTEKDPAWLTEGRTRYEALQQKMAKHDQARLSLRHDPSSALAAIMHRSNATGNPTANIAHDEVYLTDALTVWLPHLASARPAAVQLALHNASPEQAAIDALSSLLRTQHHDELLTDLLAGQHSATWGIAASELTAAFQANARGDRPQIIAHAEKAMKLFHTSGNKAGEAAATYQFLSGVNRSQMSDRCLQVALAGLRLDHLHHYPWVESNLLFETSTCNFMIGNPESALDYARQANAIAQNSGYKILQLQGAYFLDGVSTPWVAAPDSWDRIRAALGEYWQTDYPQRSGQKFYSDLGLAAQAEGMWHCAESIFRESVFMHSQDKDRSIIAASHHLLAQVAESAGDMTLAEEEFKQASQLLTNQGSDATSIRIGFEIERAALEVRMNKLDQAAQRLQAVKEGIPSITNHYAKIPYLESLGELHLHAGKLDLAEADLLAAIRLIEEDKNSLSSETYFLTWQRDTSQAYRALLRLYSQSYHDDAKAFALLEWYRAEPTRTPTKQRSHPGKSPELKQASLTTAEYLPDKLSYGTQTRLLTWISFPTSLSIFLLDRNGLHSASVKVADTALNTTVNRFIRLCADPLSDPAALDTDARQLYEWLIQPIAAHLDGIAPLIVEPDDAFARIPFHVLETRNGKYLGDLFPLVESPGAGYTQIARSERRLSQQSVILAVGDPLLSQIERRRFRPLPEAGAEASDVAARFDRHFLLTGKDASLTNVVRLLPTADIFHFAGHAVSGSHESGLVFASESGSANALLLGPKQLSRESLARLKLVVLSGCETGTASQGLVDPESLVRVFLRAGVPNVVASKWRVDSQSSAELMSMVYSHLMQGVPISEALAKAEKSVRSNPQTAHPYYWAAFSVFGS